MGLSSSNHDIDKKEWLLLLKMSASLGITNEQIKMILQSKQSHSKEYQVNLTHD